VAEIEKGGKPGKQPMAWCIAREALAFYRLWKKAMKHFGISDYGLSSEMEEQSIEYVLQSTSWDWEKGELVSSWGWEDWKEPIPTIEKVQQLMRKSKNSQPKFQRNPQ
jgi:hypothetical protein